MDLSGPTEKDLQTISDELHASRPEWVEGSLSRSDARYLFDVAVGARSSLAVEIGTGSGVSTAVLCSALSVLSGSGEIGTDFHVASYDSNQRFYADSARAVGDAARDMLPKSLLDRVHFHSPAAAIDVCEHYPSSAVGLLFVDGNHRHPWPTLDLLATLHCLQEGSQVVLHDINLPLRRSKSAAGAKYLFDDADLEKSCDQGEEIPNIGSLRIPGDKDRVREQLLEIVSAHEWEVQVPERITSRLLK